MSLPDRFGYLAEVVGRLKAHWPDNETVTVACHGHSVRQDTPLRRWSTRSVRIRICCIVV